MAKITIQYDDGRPDHNFDAAQFILFHVPPSDQEEQIIMTAQCSSEFLRLTITEENARNYYNQSFKAMSRKRLGE